MKTEKSPAADVWDLKIWLGRRTALPFVSADRYDSKEACKHTCYLLKTNRKFSRGTQSQASWRLKSIFYVSKWSGPLLPLKWVSKLKDHQQLTFRILKSDCVVVQHSRLFLRIDMIPKMLANTHVTCWRPKETFLTALRAKRHDPPQGKMTQFWCKSSKKTMDFAEVWAFDGVYRPKNTFLCFKKYRNVFIWVKMKYFAIFL